MASKMRFDLSVHLLYYYWIQCCYIMCSFVRKPALIEQEAQMCSLVDIVDHNYEVLYSTQIPSPSVVNTSYL